MHQSIQSINFTAHQIFLEYRRARSLTFLSVSAALNAWLGPAQDEPSLILLSYVVLFIYVFTWERKNRYRRALPLSQRTLLSLPALIFLALFLYKFITVVPVELLSGAVLQSTSLLTLIMSKKG